VSEDALYWDYMRKVVRCPYVVEGRLDYGIEEVERFRFATPLKVYDMALEAVAVLDGHMVLPS
jgi:hypothetical protein